MTVCINRPAMSPIDGSLPVNVTRAVGGATIKDWASKWTWCANEPHSGHGLPALRSLRVAPQSPQVTELMGSTNYALRSRGASCGGCDQRGAVARLGTLL